MPTPTRSPPCSPRRNASVDLPTGSEKLVPVYRAALSSPPTPSPRIRTQECVPCARCRIAGPTPNPPQTLEQILDLLVTRHKMGEVAEILQPLLAEMRSDLADQQGRPRSPR